jgi:hypothetical protein
MSDKKKPDLLAAFSEATRPTPAPAARTPRAPARARPAGRGSSPPVTRGRRGSQERPTVPFRMSRRTWERVHQLALSEGLSIQRLLFDELARGFARRGLPPLEE